MGMICTCHIPMGSGAEPQENFGNRRLRMVQIRFLDFGRVFSVCLKFKVHQSPHMRGCQGRQNLAALGH